MAAKTCAHHSIERRLPRRAKLGVRVLGTLSQMLRGTLVIGLESFSGDLVGTGGQFLGIEYSYVPGFSGVVELGLLFS